MDQLVDFTKCKQIINKYGGANTKNYYIQW